MIGLIIIISCLIGIPLSITLGIKSLHEYDRSESTVSFVGFLCLTFIVPIFLVFFLFWITGRTPGA
jgi:ABC-type antimicrobial peptide transport system permease subunit